MGVIEDSATLSQVNTKTNQSFVIIVHDLRSAHNVGSLLRTADGLGVDQVIFTGHSPYPKHANDERLPHIANKIDQRIHKTALGAEKSVSWEYEADIETLIAKLKEHGYTICALEQDQHATNIVNFRPPGKLALLLGREVEGIDTSLIGLCDQIIEIPMKGKKESFNVVQAFAMTGYHIQFVR